MEGEAILFERLANEIKIRDGRKDKHLFSARPVLNADGECMMEIVGESEQRPMWQISRKALDDLFFGF